MPLIDAIAERILRGCAPSRRKQTENGVPIEVARGALLIVRRDIEDQHDFIEVTRRILLWGVGFLVLIGLGLRMTPEQKADYDARSHDKDQNVGERPTEDRRFEKLAKRRHGSCSPPHAPYAAGVS